MGCTYVKEFSFGGKVTPATAVRKHEKALHPGKPMTKMAKGGKVMEKATGETYPSRKAMMKHEKEETPRMQREEIMQKSSMRAPRRSVPVASSEPLIAMKKGGPPPMPDPKTQMGAKRPMPRPTPMPERPMPQPQRDPRPMPKRPMPRPTPMPTERPMPRPTPMPTERPRPQPQRDPRPMPERPMPRPTPMPTERPRPQVTPPMGARPMMKKGGMHKMPDGKMMKNSAMKKGGMANPNC